MTGKERANLRARANGLDPIIQIGKDGISDNLIRQIDDTLDARELIKLRVHLETAPETPREFANQLAQELNADVIQVIGGIIVLYRELDEEKALAKKRAAKTAKAKPKKKVKIKGMRQRNKEKEAKNSYVKYDRHGGRGRQS